MVRLKQNLSFLDKTPLPEKVQICLPSLQKKVIVIAGPTGVGKTALSLAIAKEVRGEVISADSVQVYQGMDIGTAKISFAQMNGIPHHLLSVRTIDQSFNVVDFAKEASQKIDEIHSRGSVPVVVGGTGFYLHALIYGAPEGPASSPIERERFEKEMEERGAAVLYHYLTQTDPEYAATITSNDKQKIIRALEIISLTGKKVSEFGKHKKKSEKYDFRCWFLYMQKETLYQQIEQRCEEMLQLGFLDEVRRLDQVGLRKNLSASQAIGYRQALDFLASAQTPDDWDHFLFSFKQASRRYARRQLTWFRKEPLFQWINREGVSLQDISQVLLHNFYHL